MRKFDSKINQLTLLCKNNAISRYRAVGSLEGWLAYVKHADTYKYRRDLVRRFNQNFPTTPATKLENPKKNKNFVKKVKTSGYPFSSQKTLQLHKQGLLIKEIAIKRNIKQSTVWEHFAKLIEYNQLSVWKVLPKDKIMMVSKNIYDKSDKLKDIKQRINDNSITFDDIACVLAFVRNKDRKKLK